MKLWRWALSGIGVASLLAALIILALELVVANMELAPPNESVLLRLTVDRHQSVNVHDRSALGSQDAGPVAVFIHGSMYDPGHSGAYSPFLTTYPVWNAALQNPVSVEVGWYSYPTNTGGLFNAWRDGSWHWYSAARKASSRLAGTIEPFLLDVAQDEIVLVCHSFGCNAAFELVENGRLPISRVIAFAAATPVATTESALENSNISLLSVAAADDAPLRALARSGARSGSDLPLGLASDFRHPRMHTVLVNPASVNDAEAANGNDPRRFGDHVLGYEWRRVWPMLRAFAQEGRTPPGSFTQLN